MQMYKRVYRNGDAKGELFRKEKGDKTLMMCTVQYELDSHTCLIKDRKGERNAAKVVPTSATYPM